MPEQYISPLSTLVNWIDSERQKNRQMEDQDLDRRISLIHDMINSPGANPARTAEGIRGILELQSAKGGRGKQQGGLGGFMGKQQEVLPDFLAHLIHGEAPFEGNTYSIQHQPLTQPPNADVIPSTKIGWAGQAPAGVAGDQQPTGSGQSVLNSPIQIPQPPLQMAPTATRMADAGKQMQQQAQFEDVRVPLPPNQQPFRIAPLELAEEQGQAAGIKETAISDAKTQAQMRMLKQAGFSDDEIKTILQRQALKGVNEFTGDTTPDIIKGADGKFYYQFSSTDKATGQVKTSLIPAPEGAIPFKAGAAGSTKLNADQLLAQELFGNSDLTALTPEQTHSMRLFKESDAYQQWAKKAQTSSSLATGRAWAAPDIYDTTTPQGGVVPTAVPKGSLRPGATPPAGSVPPPPKAEKLGTDEQNFVDTAQGVQGTMNRIQTSIEQAGLQHANSIKDWSSTQAQNWIRRMGFEPSQFQADLQQQTGYIRATLLRSLLGGRPNKYVVDIFQQHLPAEFQTPAQLYNTLKLVRQEMNDRYQGISAGHGGQALPPLAGSQAAQDKEFADFLNSLKK